LHGEKRWKVEEVRYQVESTNQLKDLLEVGFT
jgi:hypothetical protein